MADLTSDAYSGPAAAGPPPSPLEPFGEEESWQLISPGGVGRIGYSGRFGPTILPVNFRVQEKALYFRTARHSTMEEDLHTGIAHADYKVAFQVDHFDEMAHTGWSVLVQGDVHPMESDEERAAASATCSCASLPPGSPGTASGSSPADRLAARWLSWPRAGCLGPALTARRRSAGR